MDPGGPLPSPRRRKRVSGAGAGPGLAYSLGMTPTLWNVLGGLLLVGGIALRVKYC